MNDPTLQFDVKNHFNYVPTLGYSPINLQRLAHCLIGYPTRDNLVEKFKYGFPLHFEGVLHQDIDNCPNTTKNLDILLPLIQKEVSSGRADGPFKNPPFPQFRCSPMFLVPKKDPNKYRLIFNLSHPPNSSVNDEIDPELSKVSYSDLDDVIKIMLHMPGEIYLAKADIQAAFKLLPVHTGDQPLLLCQINSFFYIMKTMPEGFTSSCKNFEDFSSAVQWMVEKFSKIDSYPELLLAIRHYLDDFIFLSASENGCKYLLEIFILLCSYLGIPLAEKKLVYPTKIIEYLGFIIDTVNRIIKIPKDKVDKLLEKISMIESKKRCVLREVQQLLGLMNYVSRACPPARAYTRRIIDSIKGGRQPWHYVNITRAFKEDLQVWKIFLKEFNGDVFWLPSEYEDTYELATYSDASGSIGFGATFKTHWVQGRWKQTVVLDPKYNIEFQELLPIVLSCEVWGSEMANKRLLFHCDNQPVVDIINKKSSSDPEVMVLVRRLVLICLKSNIMFRAKHVPGKALNQINDSLSRFHMQKFRSLMPEADQHPALIPFYYQQYCQV